MKKQWVISLALLAVVVMFVILGGKWSGSSGGKGSGGTAGADKITELVVSVATAPETIDPQRNSSVDAATYLMHLNEGLLRYNWAGKGIEPGLAKSVEVSEDENGNMVLTFTIRDDARWSDGEPVTAHDFEYSFKRLVDPATASPYASDMGSFILNGTAITAEKMDVDKLGVTAVDDKTLIVIFEGFCAFYDEIMAFPSFMPVRRDIIEKYGDAWIRTKDTYITAGPYKMVNFSADEQIVMEINEHYYDKEALVATKLTWQFLDDDAGLAAFQAGGISFRSSFPQQEILAMKSAGVLSLQPTLGTYYISFNSRKAPFVTTLTSGKP